MNCQPVLKATLCLVVFANFAHLAQADRGVYKTRIAPHWFDGGDRFWYRNDLAEDRREFVLVDTVKSVRAAAFDHGRLTEALVAAGVDDRAAKRLGLEGVEFDTAENAVQFRIGGKHWRCDLKNYALTEAARRKVAEEVDGFAIHPADAPRRSGGGGDHTDIHFVNRTDGEVELLWITTGGGRQSYGKLAAGAEKTQHTYAGHSWLVVDANGKPLVAFKAEAAGRSAIITGDEIPRKPRTERPKSRARPKGGDGGKWRAFVRDHNVWIRAAEGDEKEEVQLSQDGAPDNRYEMLQWTPDSKTLIAFRVQPGEPKEVYRIESSPKDGGRAKLHRHNYALPGDKFASFELNLFDVAERKQIKPEVEPVDFGRQRVRFSDDGERFTYEKVDRGHQRFRLIEVDPQTGDTRNIIDEQTDTFIWRAHTQSLGIPLVKWLEKTEEIIYVSERDGWRHLYLIDPKTGKTKSRITNGDFVVRRVDQVDEEKRQVWFRASGKNSGQDPYLIHYYRVNFDGSGLVALTEGHGSHSIAYSPDRRFIVDSYSRVDMAPVHELRRVSDGKLMCELEKADSSELERSGWQRTEVFSAKGRDGKTDIWGIICRPRGFDPAQNYPIIEDIYAGPHSSFVPKTFSPGDRYRSLTELGFIVVKIDGMGTANRSKAFHDVCWHNLKDAGFPDRILWIRAAAKKYPYMDPTRVGIYGTSAGGQSAAGGVLFHPDFYKAAYAACGCHDNRMDKASWNEQWMGYPVGPHYAESSNIDNAHRLRGHLMLMVGEMDNNVPPESTLRLAGALIRAGKDFDLIFMPGTGHSGGGGYGNRRMRDFFVKHLQGVEPSNRNSVAD